jgi:alkyl sulfatase BDS1-like metallo-beta-lactamase superfamily hydrolase
VVRNVYRQFGGWWDGNAANLKPAREAALAAEVVALAGSVEALTDRARVLAEAGDLRLACHLVEMAVAAEPMHEGAQRARADVFVGDFDAVERCGWHVGPRCSRIPLGSGSGRIVTGW